MEIEPPLRLTKDDGPEYVLEFNFVLKENQPYAEAGHELAFEQVVLREATRSLALPEPENNLTWQEDAEKMEVNGANFSLSIGKLRGSLASFKANGKERIVSAGQPQFYRVPTDNDQGGGERSYASRWNKAGINNLMPENIKITASKLNNGLVKVSVNTRYACPARYSSEKFKVNGYINTTTDYLIGKKGQMQISLEAKIDTGLPPLARVGYTMGINGSEADSLVWRGRGPHESYPDRKEGARLGIFNQLVFDLYQPHCRPQEYGNLFDISFLKIKSGGKELVEIEGEGDLNVSCRNYSDGILERADYLNQLFPSGYLTLHIDHKLMGVGGDDSWSPRVHKEYLLNSLNYKYSFNLNLKD